MSEASRARLQRAWVHVITGLAPEISAAWSDMERILEATGITVADIDASKGEAGVNAAAKKRVGLGGEEETAVGLALATLAILPTLSLATALVLHGTELQTAKERRNALKEVRHWDRTL